MPWVTLTGPLAVLWDKRPCFIASQPFVHHHQPTPMSLFRLFSLIALFSHETTTTDTLLLFYLSIYLPIYLSFYLSSLFMYYGPLENHKSLYLRFFFTTTPFPPPPRMNTPHGEVLLQLRRHALDGMKGQPGPFSFCPHLSE